MNKQELKEFFEKRIVELDEILTRAISLNSEDLKNLNYLLSLNKAILEGFTR